MDLCNLPLRGVLRQLAEGRVFTSQSFQLSPLEQINSPAVFTAGMPWAWVLLAVQKYQGKPSITVGDYFWAIYLRNLTHTNQRRPINTVVVQNREMENRSNLQGRFTGLKQLTECSNETAVFKAPGNDYTMSVI